MEAEEIERQKRWKARQNWAEGRRREEYGTMTKQNNMTKMMATIGRQGGEKYEEMTNGEKIPNGNEKVIEDKETTNNKSLTTEMAMNDDKTPNVNEKVVENKTLINNESLTTEVATTSDKTTPNVNKK